MMDILRNTPATLELEVYQDGTLTDLDANPTLALTDANGDTVSTGTVTKPGGTTGTYRSVLPSQTELKTLKAVWSGALSTESVSFTQRYEIVGNLLFTEAQARAKTISGLQTPLSDENNYPDADLARMRSLITDKFEERTGKAWTRRYCRMELAGTGTHLIDFWDGEARDHEGNPTGGPAPTSRITKVIAATIDGNPVTVSELVVRGRRLHHTNGVFTRGSQSDPLNVIVEYEYGPDPVPLDANEEGLRMVVANLVPSDVSGYAQSFAGEDGTVTFGPHGLAWPQKTWDWLKTHKPVLVA